MDQKKIGSFLRELRNEKKLTQQQLAEVINVSNRTISRWETGSNMPDLDLVLELADYYQVDIREILDGERKSENMDKELKETVMKVAKYSNDEKKNFVKRINVMFILAIIAFIIYMIMEMSAMPETGTVGFIKGLTLGIDLGMLIIGALYTSRFFSKIQKFKMRLMKMEKE